jgi:UDP-N-acetyl-D-mannosaminuronate dehydrogenase
MPTPSEVIQAGIAAYRAEIMDLDEAERAPALQHLDAAEQHLAATERWVTTHQQRREGEAELARQRAALADYREG